MAGRPKPEEIVGKLPERQSFRGAKLLQVGAPVSQGRTVEDAVRSIGRPPSPLGRKRSPSLRRRPSDRWRKEQP